MQLTEHTDLGLRLLLLLAAVAPERVPARRLADWHKLSYPHVQKVVQSLQAAGFVHTFRGRAGGVQLARSADEIRVGDVVLALEPHLNFVECFAGTGRCRLEGGCGLTGVLVRAKSAMLDEMNKATIGQLARDSRHLPSSVE